MILERVHHLKLQSVYKYYTEEGSATLFKEMLLPTKNKYVKRGLMKLR